jgi:hypothetical protein
MNDANKKPQKLIVDLELLNRLNAEGCPACGRKFTLGEEVVAACGAWEGGAKMIHENEAVWDSQSLSYVERKCYAAGRSPIA